MKIERALQRLNDLIDVGYEFPEAIDAVSKVDRLTDSQRVSVIALYDAQG